jgi:molybdopterin-synthase adenylyltransferase
MKPESTSRKQKLRALRVQLIETNDGVILKRGRAEIKIGGKRAAEVVQVVLTTAADGGATLDEICELFAGPDRPAVDYLVRQLEARRILVPTDGVSQSKILEGSLDIFYWQLGEHAELTPERMNSQRVVIMGVNCISRQLAASLAASGMNTVDVINYPLLCNLRLFDDNGKLPADEWPPSLKPPLDYAEWVDRMDPATFNCLVATSDFGGLQLMRTWNEFCVKQNIHFLPVVLQDLIGYVGPLVVPGETACFECLRARQNSHMEDPHTRRAAEAVAFEGQAVTGFHPSMASVLGDIAAIELTKFYGRWMPSRMASTLIEVNLLIPQLAARKVLKIPRCATCSPLNTRSAASPNKSVFIPHEAHE